MEFWKRKKSTAPSGSINPASISEPIHNMDSPGSSQSNRGTTPPPFPGTVRSQSNAPDLPAGFGDAEFRERYKTYRQQRRLSHTNSSARSSQLTTASENTVVSQPDMPRQRSHESEAMVVSDEPSGPPRGSLRSTRSAAPGRGVSTVSDSAYAARTTSMGTTRPAPFMASTSSMSVATTSSLNSTASRRSAMSAHAPTGEHDPDHFGEEEINLMLGRLMDEMDIKDAQRLQMQKMSLPNKLKLLKQQRQLESFQVDSKGNAPEYFYRYLTETDIRSLPKQMLVHLRVCVSTQPVNWVKQFVEMQGLEALSECLGFLNHAGMRKGDDITKEIEIIKCIKSVVNIQWGAQDVLRYPTCVHNLCFSIDAPSLLTRRLISEILTYICYLNVPIGHTTVLKGLDKLQKFREMQKRFEPWLRALESAIDGRGRMGSKVGASEELRQLGGTADRDLTDYVLSSMILINAVVGVSDDVEMRMHYRSQLNAAGMPRIIKKLRTGFDSPLISLQINKFDKDAEQDHADVLELYNQQIMQDMTDPEEVFQAILAQIDDDERSRDHFLSILQRLLLLRDDYSADMNGGPGTEGRATKARYYQLLDEITTQVVMDIRNGESLDSDYDSDFDTRPTRPRGANEAFSSQYGVSVAGIIDKFSNEEQLEEAVREAKDLRDQLEKVTRQKNELELEVSLKSEGLVGTLKTKIFALEDLLRMSRHTIEALQTQIKELRDQFTQKLAKQDSQLKQLYSALQDEAGEHDMLRRLKDDLTLENEVLRSGVALEVSEDNPDELVLNQELLLAEIEKLKQQRPELNRMTEARQMLEQILREAGQGTPVKKVGSSASAPVKSAASNTERSATDSERSTAESDLPAGAKMGTVTMDSVMSTPARLADFASELEKKLGYKKAEVESKSVVEEKAEAVAIPEAGASVNSKTEPLVEDSIGAAAESQASSTSSTSAESKVDSMIPPAPPLPPMAGGNAPPAPPLPPMVGGAAPPAAPPLPPLNGVASLPVAPPLPPMGGGIVKPSANALAAVKLRSSGQTSSASGNIPAAPPAPPIGGRSVPLPPPPMSNSFLGTLRRKELPYVPKVKLKALQWDKLNDQNVESSMWSKLEDRSGLKENDVMDTLHSTGTFTSLEKLFAAKQAVDIFALREKRRKEREEKKLEEITVLDSKRSYDVNIMLGMMKKLTFRDIRRALLRMDMSVISENMLKQLLTYAPTPEERGLLSAYQGRPDRKRLARAERFFLETMKIWHFEQRLRVTTTWAAWPETYRDLQQDIASVMTAAHAVSTSRHFPQVLEVVLSIGNFMNGSGFRGGAFGFKIASLNRLMDTKAEDNKTTLLHFVAATVEENFPDALEFLEELKPVDSGCRVSYTEMKAEMGDMRVRLAEAKRELELLREQREKELKEIAMDAKAEPAQEKGKFTEDASDENDKQEADARATGKDEANSDDSESELGSGPATTSASSPNDRFLLTVRRFVVEATEQFESLSSQFTAMEEAFSNAMLLYGEESRGMAPEEFFGIFKTFTASFNLTHRDNVRERERKRAAEKRRKQIELHIEQKKMAKQNRANRLATGASRIREQIEGESQSESALSSSAMADVPAASAQSIGGENGAVDDLLKSLMAGTDMEHVEATKRRRRRELMSIRRRSSVRRSIHRTSISIKALQMLRDIKEDGEDMDTDQSDEQHVPPMPSANRRSIMRRHPDRMTTITEDDSVGSADFDMAERRAARRRQLLED
ncbi:hypothetical protein IW147_003002 [Coemansia sp. RSA 720]|nr:hypothetical protein IW147_003002 [Coemansia sp. RSA 720]